MRDLLASRTHPVGRCGPTASLLPLALLLLYCATLPSASVSSPEGLRGPEKVSSHGPLAVAWLTDIHLEQRYSARARPEDRCIEDGSPSSEVSNSVLEMETDPELGRAGCSSSPRLVDETLNFLQGLLAQSRITAAWEQPAYSDRGMQSAASALRDYPLPPIETVLLTGDFVQYPKEGDPLALKEGLQRLARSIFERFPQKQSEHQPEQKPQSAVEGVQLLVVIGSHELPVKFMLRSYRREWTEVLYNIWKPALPDDERTRGTFLRGLYYSTTLRGDPRLRVLCLNTNLYFKTLREAARALEGKLTEATGAPADINSLSIIAEEMSDYADPAGQLAWLEEELRAARSLGQQVLITGHVMPGITARLGTRLIVDDNWEESYASRYRDLVAAHSDLVVAQLYGHEHEGQVRVMLPHGNPAWRTAEAGGPGCAPKSYVPTAILTCPSVSAEYGNNPAMRVLLFESWQHVPEQGEELEEEAEAGRMSSVYHLADYAQYHLPLYGFTGTSGFGGATPTFRFESSFQDIFRPFMRSAKPPQPPEEEGEEEGRGLLPGSPRTCIDGSAAMQVAAALQRSILASSVYQTHRYAGGLAVASVAVSCSSMAVTNEDVAKCLYRRGQRLPEENVGSTRPDQN